MSGAERHRSSFGKGSCCSNELAAGLAAVACDGIYVRCPYVGSPLNWMNLGETTSHRQLWRMTRK